MNEQRTVYKQQLSAKIQDLNFENAFLKVLSFE